MCSIEEAWAGQDFDGNNVVSQGDMHNKYMSLPDNILNRDNELTIKKTNQPPLKNVPRGINSKYSREPRVPKILRNTNNADINISSVIPDTNNYGGLEPLPSYMSIYNNTQNQNQKQNYQSQSQSHKNPSNYPMPITTGEQFTDINNAYNISDTLSTFMNTDSNLLDEDTEEDIEIINNKFKKNKKNNKNNLTYNDTLNYDYDNTNSITNPMNINNQNIIQLLNAITIKLDNMETQLSNYNNKNIYDLILYIIIGILFSFCVYSIFSKHKGK